MSTLHTINKSTDTNLLKSCLDIIGKNDSILFIEDGVYHCVDNSLVTIDARHTLYGLREDLLARAILPRSTERVELIDTAEFVALCCEHDKVVSWF
jgi:tRNA 2-thiouridine synthesizing protein B